MIRLRLSAFTSESSDKTISYIENEILENTIKRSLKEYNLENREDKFQVLVNGHFVDKDFWNTIQVNEKDNILIAPKITSGDSFMSFLKIAAVLAVTIYTGGTLAPAWGLPAGSFGAGMLAAGAAMVTSLSLNALIPPPIPDQIGYSGSSVESSQMYSVNSQSNTAKRYGGVPKVYGQHKIFPPIAANPYTEIEVDHSTGDLVQYFYCIYDLGYGPMYVDDIKIGDTPLLNFATNDNDMEYHLVDLNRPEISEGEWDDVTVSNFVNYKGDSETDNTSATLNKNELDGGAIEDYQIIRYSSPNTELVDQEIILTFICPQGLVAYSSAGDSYDRNIDLKIEFSKLDEDNWASFDNIDFVKNFKAVGGNQSTIDTYMTLPDYQVGGNNQYSQITYYPKKYTKTRNMGNTFIDTYYTYGISKGATYIILNDSSANPTGLEVGKTIYFNGLPIGKVQSISSYVGDLKKYNLVSPTTVSISLFDVKKTELYQFTNPAPYSTTYTITGSTNNRMYRKAEGHFTISRKLTGQIFSSVKFTPKEKASYKLRITRYRSYSDATFRVVDGLVLSSIVTRFDRNPIVTDQRHTFLELKIKATNQLNGAIQNLSAVCTSVLDIWDGTQWTKQATDNPAWIFADILTGSINKKAISKDRLHLDSLLDWADFCDEVPDAPTGQLFYTPRFSCNFVLDFDTTIQQLLNQIANASQASLNVIDGKYGVLIDRKRTVPVQIFTPRNIMGFSSSKTFSNTPNSLKVRFIDPNRNWEVNEKIVYDDGYNSENVITSDEISTFACTDPDQAWRFGRYMLAQNKLRQEIISITVDFEYLVCTRGDYVQITQDVMRVGGTPARVKSVDGNIITIDDKIDIIEGSYGYVSRTLDGIITSTLTILDSDSFELDGDIPSIGDLIVIGPVGSIVYDCIVKSITPNDDLSANIVLIEKADGVYDAESSDQISDYDPQISYVTESNIIAPKEVTNLSIVENSYSCGANSFEHFIHVDWDAPKESAYELFEVYLDNGKGYSLETSTRLSEYIYYVDNSKLNISHSFKVLAVSASGKKLDLAIAPSVSTTPQKKISPVKNLNSISVNITGETITLDWEPLNDCVKEYLIRYSPDINSPLWSYSVPIITTDKNTTIASVQARTGAYLIKAKDWNDNESIDPAVAITTIPELFNLNIIETIKDPIFNGEVNKVKSYGSSLTLSNETFGGVLDASYYSEGYYYFKNLLDLGEIYTVRLQSKIKAIGYETIDILDQWTSLESVDYLTHVKSSDWGVQAEYRTTSTFNSIIDWVTLDSIDPISEGNESNWSEYRRFSIGDSTGRVFQFRVKLFNTRNSVTPKVFDVEIKADMPDRLDSYEDLVATTEGYEILYNPPFKGPGTTPNIQISVHDFGPGDYYRFDYKNLDGFKIIFYDKDYNPVSKTFDVQIKGYGRKTNAYL